MTSQEVRDLAATAAAELRRRGWTRRTLFDNSEGKGFADCKVCALGAILAASGNLTGDYDTFEAQSSPEGALAKAYANTLGRQRYPAVYQHNDTVAKSVDDVLAVFDKIAAGDAEEAA